MRLHCSWGDSHNHLPWRGYGSAAPNSMHAGMSSTIREGVSWSTDLPQTKIHVSIRDTVLLHNT